MSKPTSISVTLDQAAELLQKHRMQNPQFELATDFFAVRKEILDYNRLRLGLPPSDQATPQWPQRHGFAAGVAAGIGKTAAGIRLAKQWLGDDLKTVPQTLATSRAAICAKCPQNQKADLFQTLNVLAARELKLLVEYKNSRKLTVPNEKQLETCKACLCHLPLKVHTPLKHILANMSCEVRSELDPKCWVLHEQDAG